MRIYLNKRLIVVETNLAFAIPYWTKRKQSNPNISWELTNA